MHNEKRYFASANTDRGFVSYFDEVFSKLDYVYIIKGGSGTGKSSFIRKLADRAELEKMGVEYFYCSSDPLSLDGIIIEDMNIAVIDGTHPHTYDPRMPGIKDRIINLGDNWNKGILNSRRDEIITLTNKKRDAFNNVYNYLSAVGRINDEVKYTNQRLVKIEKMQSAVDRLTRGWKPSGCFFRKIRLIESISHAGHIKYGTYSTLAENQYIIRDRYGIGGMLLKMIEKTAEHKSIGYYYSPSIFDRNENTALFLPSVSSSFVIINEDSFSQKTINMDRFIDVDLYKQNKHKNRFARRCLNSIFEGVQKGMDEIFELHTALEQCYINAMDFSKNERLAQEIISEIFA